MFSNRLSAIGVKQGADGCGSSTGLVDPAGAKAEAHDRHGTSPVLRTPPMLCGLLRKNSRLPSAASAY